MRSYAIGDIHGRLGLLLGAHALIAADRLRTQDDAAPIVLWAITSTVARMRRACWSTSRRGWRGVRPGFCSGAITTG